LDHSDWLVQLVSKHTLFDSFKLIPWHRVLLIKGKSSKIDLGKSGSQDGVKGMMTNKEQQPLLLRHDICHWHSFVSFSSSASHGKKEKERNDGEAGSQEACLPEEDLHSLHQARAFENSQSEATGKRSDKNGSQRRWRVQ